MSRRPQPVQQEPPAQWLRLRYAKRGPARFTSTRDFGRAFERALRRADVPMAFSSGFSPHPRISYANAAPTGAATEAEYLEIGLARRCDPEKLRAALNDALPPGISLEQVAERGAVGLADRLEASLWRLDVADVPAGTLAAAAAALLAAPEVMVSRMTKSGLRTFDARAAVLELTAGEGAMTLLSRQGTPLVRPDDVVTALRTIHPEFDPPAPVLFHRLAQGPLVDGGIGDPLAEMVR